ncbi:MAG: pyruvate kinase alpha/beta domain-containing protein [Euryarchaeota archaeon]|nr:pyruvate kinase alpha/beta domain-containing protein [Euryarchaeota archaeon]
MRKDITYFEEPGAANTDETVRAAVGRAVELGIKHIVVASTTGSTGIAVAKAAEGTGIKTIVATLHYGARGSEKLLVEESNLKTLEEMGAAVFTQTHTLSGVERSFTDKLGGASRSETIAAVLKSLFGIGFKVAVEITIMAADSGMIPVSDDSEVIAIGGTGTGADVACVIKPGHANSFFEMQIREIIVMPRVK